MVHSVELLFDAATDATVRDIWESLAANGIRSQAAHTSPSNRPHVTLTVAAQLDAAADDALRPLSDRLPLPCVLGAPVLFGGGRHLTLARLVVPSAELLAVHADVHETCLPHMPAGPLPHTAPGQWTPHVTLARRVPPDLLGDVVSDPGFFRDIPATVAGLRHWDGGAKTAHPIG